MENETKEKPLRVYISGKITGKSPEQAKSDFKAAANYLHKLGHVPISPLNNGLPPESAWENHMRVDIRMLTNCDRIYLLPDWQESKGALIEAELAGYLGIGVIE